MEQQQGKPQAQVREEEAELFFQNHGIKMTGEYIDKEDFLKFASSIPTEVQKEEWISVEERLPDNKKDVLGTNGKSQFVCNYTKGHEIEYEDYDYDGEYDPVEEKNGCLYLKPGWYENEETPGGQFDEVWVERKVTHWRPLPAPPNTVSSAPPISHCDAMGHYGGDPKPDMICPKCGNKFLSHKEDEKGLWKPEVTDILGEDECGLG